MRRRRGRPGKPAGVDASASTPARPAPRREGAGPPRGAPFIPNASDTPGGAAQGGERGAALPERVEGLEVVRSPDNPRLRAAKALVTGRGRRRAGQFLLEGPKVVLEALTRRPAWVETLFVRLDGPRVPPGAAEAVAAARAAGVACAGVAARLFDHVAPAETPQPVLAVARQGWADLDEVLGPPGPAPRAVAALAGVQDPGNVGTILRTARFFGLAGVVLLPGAQDPWSPKVVRASAGALLETPPARVEALEDLLRRARAAGLVPVALDAHGGDDPRRAPLPPRALLLLGAEGPGLPPDLVTGPDPAQTVRRVTLAPGDPAAESLNVAVAFGVVAALWAGAAVSGPPSPGA